MIRQMAVQKVRERMEIFQKETLNEMDRRLDIMVDEFLHEVKRFDVQNNELRQLFHEQNGAIRSKRK